MVVPFRAIVRNTKSNIEDECAKLYPELMDYSELQMEGLHNLRKMQALIQRSLTKDDYSGFVYELVRLGLLSPVRPNENFLKFIHVNIDEVNCKVYYEQRIPHLIIDGDFVIDIKAFFEHMDDKKLIKFKFNRSFTHLEIIARLTKSLPIIGRRINVSKFKEEFQRHLTDRIYDKKSKTRAQALEWAGGDQVAFERSSLSTKWLNDQEMLFVFDKLYTGFVEKLWKNKYKIAATALIYKSIRKGKNK